MSERPTRRTDYAVSCSRCGVMRLIDDSTGQVPGWLELSLNVEQGPNFWEFCSPQCLSEWINKSNSLDAAIHEELRLLAQLRTALGKPCRA